jgi:hypothetical protein
MQPQPLPLVGGAYADETKPWSMQDTVNYLPCRAERAGTRSPEMLKTPPGLRPYVEVASETYTTVRGIHNCEGRLFAVIGRTLYQISKAKVAVPIGTIPGFGRVTMDHNQISLGNQLTVSNGSAGYVYNTVTGTFGRITDPGYPGSAITKFLDGFMIGIEPQGRFAFNSGVAAATDFNTLDRFTSEVTPDRLISAAVTGNELMILSVNSCEFFQNTGAIQQPFRSKRIAFDKGCAGAYVVSEADNSVFWLGSDGYFYRLSEYSAVRISTRPIEQAIRGLKWSQAYSFVWEDAGHTVIYWTFPDGRTWGFDVAHEEWHRRESYGMDRWRVSCTARYTDGWIAGDFQRGRLWNLDWDYMLEGAEKFVSQRTTAVSHANQNRFITKRLELVMDTGQPETTAVGFPEQPEGPRILTEGAPTGQTTVPYSYTPTVSGGLEPYRFSVTKGTLPAGLTLSSAGVLSGTPTAYGSSPVTFRVTDANGLWGEVDDTIIIAAYTALPVLAYSAGWYSGAPADLDAEAGPLNYTGAAGTIVVAPNGKYAVHYLPGQNPTSVPDAFQLLKHDTTTGLWSKLSDPAYIPDGTMNYAAWNAFSGILAVTCTRAAPFDEESLIIYQRTGDVFAKVGTMSADLDDTPTAVAFTASGTRVAVVQEAAPDRIAVYDFDAVTGNLTNQRTGVTGADALTFTALEWEPESDYIAGGSAAGTSVFRDVGSSITNTVRIAKNGEFGVFWTDEGQLVSVGNDTPAIVLHTVVKTPGSEALEAEDSEAAPAGSVVTGAAISAGRVTLAVACEDGAAINGARLYNLGTVDVITYSGDGRAEATVLGTLSYSSVLP